MRGRPETVYALLETIESHHGQYAAAPAWGSIHIVGVNLDSVSIDRIADGLGLASVRLEAESDGFVIRRAAHTHAAADGGRAHGDE